MLDDLSLEFPASGIVGIIGPNGAGKTTLINTLTGFLRPKRGRVFLGEREITRLEPHRIARLGVARTFQDLRLILKVPTLENVMLARPNQRGEKVKWALLPWVMAEEEARNRDHAMRLLRLIGIDHKASETAGELSYGEQKLLTLACCLATEARILFLDEPVAGVHPEMAARIIGMLAKIRDEGKLIIFIEHDIAAVKQLADTLIVMNEGKVIAKGDPSEVLLRRETLESYLA